MKKPVIALIALAVAGVSSVGAFLAVKNKKDTETRQEAEALADNVLFNFDSAGINKIDFVCEDGLYTAELADEVWTLTNSDDFSLDQTYIQLVCTYMSTLTAVTSYGAIDDEKKSMYGLDNSTAIIMYDADGTSYSLNIGDLSPTGDYYYVTSSSKNNVYALESLYGSVLKSGRLLLKDKTLVPYDLYSIEEIIIKKDGKVTCDLSFDPDTNIWSLPAEYSSLAMDQTAVTAVVNVIVRLEAEEMLDENLKDFSKYGFDAPVAEAIIKGLDGTERKLLVSYLDADPSYAYVLTENDNQVELYYKADLSFVEKTPYDYIVQTFTGADMYNITGFELNLGGIEETFTVNANERTCEYNGITVDIKNSDDYIIFQNFYNSFSLLSITEIELDAAPELDEPVLTAVYHLAEGGDTTVQLVSEKDKLYIFRDGEYTGLTASGDIFEGRTSVNEFYARFKELAEG